MSRRGRYALAVAVLALVVAGAVAVWARSSPAPSRAATSTTTSTSTTTTPLGTTTTTIATGYPGMPPVVDPTNIYSETGLTHLSPLHANDPALVYVPNGRS